MAIKYDEPTDFLGKLKCAIGLCGSFGDYIVAEDGAFVRLYNLREDPGETYNLAAKEPEIVNIMRTKLAGFEGIIMPPQENQKINQAHHKYSGGIWRPWREHADESNISYNILTKTEL